MKDPGAKLHFRLFRQRIYSVYYRTKHPNTYLHYYYIRALQQPSLSRMLDESESLLSAHCLMHKGAFQPAALMHVLFIKQEAR